MIELVYKDANDQVLTNSLLVAEKFGKEHQHILRDIRVLMEGMSKIGDTPMFEETTYTNPQNKQEYPMFIMNRDGFTLLAMGFTGQKALAFKMDFINAFNKMESMLKSDDYILMRSQQILQKRIEVAEQKMKMLEQSNKLLQEDNTAKEKQIAEEAPRVLFSKAVETSKRSCLIGELAKILQQNGINIGQNRLFKWLRENGYLCNKGEMYNQPTQKAMELGLFEIKQTVINKPDGSVVVKSTTKCSGKGQIYFVNKFLNPNQNVVQNPTQ